ncbi:xylulokinase [Tessaracoccus sp. OH4464_COT-324]|uniref:xylulokinase n=1 Tax=Tessaracoccus sp. OH4464_COT-324 TaxID=2491059 RepID=UPI000F62F589|nr:FGGY-family carbohydrate kinase [Tessaracoccus sp. OH4464_COT-324]RRD47127.1 ATPase [Tessaracoccus sp. OH4464_COT-324]
MSTRAELLGGHAALGIEFGSTRIKAVLIDRRNRPIATGSHQWSARLEDGHWTYALADVWLGVQAAYRELAAQVLAEYAVELRTVAAIGISGMMHGYLALDDEGHQLVPLRTWQDTTTKRAAQELSEVLGVNIPLRWSISHVHQAILDAEPHVARLAHLTTLAGYVHWRLTGQRVLGIGDASGMFPTDAATGDYDERLLERYTRHVEERALPWRLRDVLPKVLVAGQPAGELTAHGARLLDPSGSLQPGALFAPPEGDAGTGMVATGAVAPRTANLSAGTSIFAMVVLERPLSRPYPELDVVATPAGDDVVMVHCNNGAADLQHWVQLFGQAARALGAEFDDDQLYGSLYRRAFDGAPDAGGLVAYNFRAGEPTVDVAEGRPLFVRLPDSELNLANFMRAQLFGALASLRIGFDVLAAERVELENLYAHGGLFRTPQVAQRHLAAALRVPVTVRDTASEGGAWGMALLARYATQPSGSLSEWLAREVFAEEETCTIVARPEETAGFDAYLRRYEAALPLARAAAGALAE